MMRLRPGLCLAALLLLGCDHRARTSSQPDGGSGALPQPDSALTGLPAQGTNTDQTPVYPRATLVSLPPTESPQTNAPVAESAGNAAATSPTETTETASSMPAPTDQAPALPQVPATSANPPTDTASATSAEPTAQATPATTTASETVAPRMGDTTPSPTVESSPPPELPDASVRDQVVVLDTSMGRIVIELDDIDAPRTCANFRKLVADNFYDHTVFHRVIPNFIIQGGDPDSKSDDRASYGQGGPGYTLPAEIGLRHTRGAVAMARLPDSVNPKRESNGSQFYICVVPCPSLDGSYTVFGHVIKGMDVADKIAFQPRDSRDNPLNRIEMEVSMEPKEKAVQDASN